MKKILAGIGIVAVVFIFAVMTGLINIDLSDAMVKVKLYDSEGNLLWTGSPFSIVQGVENVAYATFTVNVQNNGGQPLDLTIDSASPAGLQSAFALSSIKTANPGETISWTSGQVQMQPYEGGNQVFSVDVKADYVYGGQPKSITKSGSVTLNIMPDPVADFTVTVVDNFASMPVLGVSYSAPAASARFGTEMDLTNKVLLDDRTTTMTAARTEPLYFWYRITGSHGMNDRWYKSLDGEPDYYTGTSWENPPYNEWYFYSSGTAIGAGIHRLDLKIEYIDTGDVVTFASYIFQLT